MRLFSREEPRPTADQAYASLFATQQDLARATDSKFAKRLELRRALVALHEVNGQLLDVCAKLMREPSEDLYIQADELIAQIRMIRKSLR